MYDSPLNFGPGVLFSYDLTVMENRWHP